MSSNEIHTMQTLRTTISLYDNRYQLGLLWIPNSNLPNNYKAAFAQYNWMQTQPNENSEKLALCENTIDQDLSKHYMRKLEPDEIPSRGWILPEHGIINPNKPGNFRLVSNAKSNFKGICLNDMLLTGPDFLCNLLGVITRFRKRKHPITPDIEGMYMQVSVNPEDRKFLRFLWGAEEPEIFEYFRFAFGAKCSSACASESHPHMKKLVYENFYMDDFFEATDDNDTAVKIIEDLRHLLQQRSFNLTNWITTDHRILQTIPEEHRSITVDEIMDPKIFKRILGINWRVTNDTLSFTTDKLHELAQKKPTQRNLLRAASSIFDPTGTEAPISIRLRITQPAIWRKGVKMDDQILREMIPELFELLDEKNNIETVEIPRHCFGYS
ncbi:uncharacterized protein LOC134838697 [Symsagittifera roscoffensis]|uniref:uncharacterized protein LOC134838697 n=1 Tax=Symsagittifera roscoffensis TaxID=84072 RepID=UPI00307B46B7